MARVVAVTGGIGSGKSAAASHWHSLGVPLIDADAISRSLTVAGGAAVALIAATFGQTVLLEGGGINRAAMRGLVFSNSEAKNALEAILHPLISDEIARRKAENWDADLVLVEIPLLFESPRFPASADVRVVVDCFTEAQIGRVMLQRGLARPEVEAIIAAQCPRAIRLQLADYVLSNVGTLEVLQQQVIDLHHRLCNGDADRAPRRR
jgi:dephospho-CoA kinase